jgi:iron complex transport system substrate-binding protein
MKTSRRRITIIVLVSLLCIILPVSAQGSRAQTPIQDISKTAVDALGREVTVSGPIERILVAGRAAVMPADALFLFPSVAEMEIVLAKTDQGLGDFFNLIRPEFSQSNRLGQQVGAEEILAYEPDLVLTKSSNYDSIVTLLEPFGIPVFVMDLETPTAWKTEIVELGKLLGDEQTPQRVIAGFEKRETMVDSKISTLEESDKPSVLMMQIASSDGVTAFSVSPKDWIQSTLASRAGGIPVWTNVELAENSWRKVSFEQIASWAPQQIILISYKAPAQPFIQMIEESGQWQQLQSVKEDNLIAAPADVLNYFQSDSRWILALQWLSAQLHPQLFPAFSMEDEIRSFYTEFYGIESKQVLDTLVEKYRQSVGLE